MNIKLTVEYDGTNYHGWQIQPTGETIQSVLEGAVSTFLRKSTRITGSGRTDAGVHALGQVVNFFSDKHYEPHRIRRGLNALTPADITIKAVEIVPDSFDARRDGRSRVYEYRILNRPTPSPFYLNRAWHVHQPMDVNAMREVIPLYYQRDRDGLPRGWIKRMKRTIRTLGWRFNADRMVMDYTLQCYIPRRAARRAT